MLSKEPVISIQNVSFSYGLKSPVLRNINLDIHEGDFVGLIGPNGGGKTTLLKLIINVLPLQKGVIKLFGQRIENFHQWSCIGYVSQKAAHFDKQFPVTVREVVAMPLIKKRDRDKIVEQALNDVDMLEHKDTTMNELSGGQQQRVLIARSLVSNPCLLVLDEPTTGVDINSQEQFYILLQTLRKEKKLTIILVSHDIDVIALQATKFACINQELVYHGKPETFIKEDYLEKLYGKNLRLILHGH